MGNQSKGQENSVRVDMAAEMLKMVPASPSQSREDRSKGLCSEIICSVLPQKMKPRGKKNPLDNYKIKN